MATMNKNVAALKEMFPSVQPRVIQSVLKSCSNNVDRAVEQLLIFGEAKGAPPQAKPAPKKPSVWNKTWETTPTPTTTTTASSSLRREGAAPTAGRPAAAPSAAALRSSNATATTDTARSTPAEPPAPAARRAPPPQAAPAAAAAPASPTTTTTTAAATRAKRLRRAACHAGAAAALAMWGNLAPTLPCAQPRRHAAAPRPPSLQRHTPAELYLRHLLYHRLPLPNVTASSIADAFRRLPHGWHGGAAPLFAKAHRLSLPCLPKLLDVLQLLHDAGHRTLAPLVADLLLERLRIASAAASASAPPGCGGHKERTQQDQRRAGKARKPQYAWGAPMLEGLPSEEGGGASEQPAAAAASSLQKLLRQKRSQKEVSKAHLLGAMAGRGLGTDLRTASELLILLSRQGGGGGGGGGDASLQRIQLGCALLSSAWPPSPGEAAAQACYLRAALPIFAGFCSDSAPLPTDTLGGVLLAVSRIAPGVSLQALVETEGASLALIPEGTRRAWVGLLAHLTSSRGVVEAEGDDERDVDSLRVHLPAAPPMWPVLPRHVGVSAGEGAATDWSGVLHPVPTGGGGGATPGVGAAVSAGLPPKGRGRGAGRGVAVQQQQEEEEAPGSVDMAVIDALLEATLREAGGSKGVSASAGGGGAVPAARRGVGGGGGGVAAARQPVVGVIRHAR